MTLEGTRVHARYDKERALDLGDICEKAEALSGFIPYLMDVDWTIGSLSLDAPARQRVAEAWSESFAEWGVLPIRELLTRDRQGILLGVESGPEGEREVSWSGEPPYRDRFRVPCPPDLLPRLSAVPGEMGLEAAPIVAPAGSPLVGQLRLERQLLRPLREAVERGQLVATADGLRPSPPERFQKRHEAEVFAGMLVAGDVAPAVRVARLVAPLERTLRFRSRGRVNGHDLQRALLPLRGESLGLYVLRDAGGIIRLAFFGRGDVLGRRRDEASRPWETTWSTDPPELLSLLRRNNYLPPGAEPGAVLKEEAAELLAWFRRPCAAASPRPLPGERVLQGFRASPGRTVGRALFGTEGRAPGDFDAAVLVAPSVRPEDNTFLYHARGIVSTGGGILSHAGLIATQFRKPALIVSGQWLREPDGSSTLLYRTPEYREEQRAVFGGEIVLFHDWREREHRLREGDLVVLDAVQGTLRVLGQEPDALTLEEELWRLGEAGRRLRRAADAPELLALRGHRVRAAHQIRRILSRLVDPVLARHAAHELRLGGGPRGGGREPRRPGGASLPSPPESRGRRGGPGLPRRARPGPAGGPRRPRGRGPTASPDGGLHPRGPGPAAVDAPSRRGRRGGLLLAARVRGRAARAGGPGPRRHRSPGRRPAPGAARRAAAGALGPARGRRPAPPRSSARSSGSTSSSAAPAKPSSGGPENASPRRTSPPGTRSATAGS